MNGPVGGASCPTVRCGLVPMGAGVGALDPAPAAE